MSDKNNYAVCTHEEGENFDSLADGHLSIVASGFGSTREAEKWVRSQGSDGCDYIVIKITRNIRVETVTRRKLVTL